MDAKKIGIIAIVVVAVVLLAWSFKKSFMNEAPVAGAQDAARMRKSMEEMRTNAAKAGSKGGHSTAPAGTGAPQ